MGNYTTKRDTHILCLSKNDVDGSIDERICVKGITDGYIAPLGKAVIDFINGSHFLGTALQKDENSPTQKWLRAHSLSEEQIETLHRLLDEVILPRDLSELDFINADIPLHADCQIHLAVSETDGGDLFTETRYYAESLYDLFIIECFEMVRFGVSIGKCEHCGKFFLLNSKRKRKYCSDACKARHNEHKSPAYEAFRRSDRAKRNYVTRTGRAPAARARYEAWRATARNAQGSYERGEISLAEFETVLSIDIKSK